MAEFFRKHYSYGETIPILNTHVGTSVDIYELTDKSSARGPYIKAVFTAAAGPMKSFPQIVEPLDNDSRVVHISDIPAPIPAARAVDLSLIFDVTNYRWIPSPEAPQTDGLLAFNLRLRAEFSLPSKSYTLLLDQRPCAITVTAHNLRPVQQTVETGDGETPAQVETGSLTYGRFEQRWPIPDTAETSSRMVTGQLDVEERLRQLGTRHLVHS